MINKLKEGHWPIFLLSSFSSIANLFLPIVLVRLLAPNDIGLYKIFFLHLSAIPFIFLCGGPINSVYYWIGKKENERYEYIQSSWMLSLLLSFLVLIIGIPLLSIIAKHLNFPIEYVLLMLISGFAWCPAGHFSETQIAKGNTVKGSLYSTSFEISKVLCFLFLAYQYKDIKLIFIAYTILLSIQFITTLLLGLKDQSIKFKINKQKLKEVWNYCLPISASGTLGFFVDKIDQLILSSKLSSAEFAFFSMGCLIVPPLIMIDMSVQKVLIPKLSSNYLEKKYDLAAEQFSKGISDISFLIIPAVAGLFYFAAPITTLLYTDKYIESVPYLQAFAFSYLLYCIPHDAVPRATGHTPWIFKIYALITPISLIGVWIAATYTNALTTLVTAIIIKFIPKIAGIIYSKHLMNWNYLDIIPFSRLSLYIGISVTLCLLSEITRPHFESQLNWFFVCGPIFAVIYLSVVSKIIRIINAR